MGTEFDEYLSSLNIKEEAKIRALIERVENTELQDSIRKERVKKLTDDIYELRAQTDEHWMRGCYSQIKDKTYYITHVFSKKSNKTPRREINRAKKIREIYLNRQGRNEDEQK